MLASEDDQGSSLGLYLEDDEDELDDETDEADRDDDDGFDGGYLLLAFNLLLPDV